MYTIAYSHVCDVIMFCISVFFMAFLIDFAVYSDSSFVSSDEDDFLMDSDEDLHLYMEISGGCLFKLFL